MECDSFRDRLLSCWNPGSSGSGGGNEKKDLLNAAISLTIH